MLADREAAEREADRRTPVRWPRVGGRGRAPRSHPGRGARPRAPGRGVQRRRAPVHAPGRARPLRGGGERGRHLLRRSGDRPRGRRAGVPAARPGASRRRGRASRGGGRARGPARPGGRLRGSLSLQQAEQQHLAETLQDVAVRMEAANCGPRTARCRSNGSTPRGPRSRRNRGRWTTALRRWPRPAPSWRRPNRRCWRGRKPWTRAWRRPGCLPAPPSPARAAAGRWVCCAS